MTYFKKLLNRAYYDNWFLYGSCIGILSMECYWIYTESQPILKVADVKSSLLAVAIIRFLYFTFFSFSSLKKLPENNVSFKDYFARNISLLIMNIFWSCFEYTILFHFDNTSFKGVVSTGIFTTFFEFFYFSVVTFATVGYGDIVPVSLTAKFIATIEILSSFVIIALSIPNFGSFIKRER